MRRHLFFFSVVFRRSKLVWKGKGKRGHKRMGSIGGILFEQILVMFLLMAVGVVLFKLKLITKEGSKTLSNILLFAVTPCLLINAYRLERTPERVQGVFLSFGLAAAGLLIAILVSRLVFGKKYPLEHFGTAFSNAGFIGIPLVQAALGEEAVLYVSAFVALLNILQWTYGVVVITDSKDAIKPRKILQNPVILSMVLSLIIFFFRIPVPNVLGRSVTFIAALNAPIAMMILGSYLAQTDVISVFLVPRLYFAGVLRLFLIPLLTIGLFYFVPETFYQAKMAILIAASAPIGANVAVFAQLNGKDYTYAVKEVCLSTIFCVVSMPLLMSFAQWFWAL